MNERRRIRRQLPSPPDELAVECWSLLDSLACWLDKNDSCVFRRASLLSLTIEDCAEYITFRFNMFGSCYVPFSKKREMETRSDCARRRRVGLAADTQFVVKLSGECRGKWLHIPFGVAAVRCTSNRERFVLAVVDLVNSFTLSKGHGHAGPIPIPYIHYQETWLSGPYSNTVYTRIRCV